MCIYMYMYIIIKYRVSLCASVKKCCEWQLRIKGIMISGSVCIWDFSLFWKMSVSKTKLLVHTIMLSKQPIFTFCSASRLGTPNAVEFLSNTIYGPD